MTAPSLWWWHAAGPKDPETSGSRPANDRVQGAQPQDTESPVAKEDPDRAQWERIRAGDVRAFEAVYLAYAPQLWTFAYRYVGARDIAEDVVQDVLHALWQHRSTLELRTTLAAYLYGAVRFRALRVRQDMARDQRARAQSMWMEPAPPAETRSNSAAETDDLHALVHRLLHRIAPPARDVLVLRWIHNMSYDDIAATLNVSPAAARQHVHRALRRLGPTFRRLLLD